MKNIADHLFAGMLTARLEDTTIRVTTTDVNSPVLADIITADITINDDKTFTIDIIAWNSRHLQYLTLTKSIEYLKHDYSKHECSYCISALRHQLLLHQDSSYMLTEFDVAELLISDAE